MRAPTSRKYVAEKGNDAKLIKTISNFLSHFSVFALEKPPKHLNFQSLFTTNIHFGGNFQWKACTYFQKICNWAGYKDARLIKNNSKFLVALLRFGFETRAPTSSDKYVAKQGKVMQNWWEIFQSFCSQTSIFALQKQPKNLRFFFFLSLINPLVATLIETHVPFSRKYVTWTPTCSKYIAEKGTVMPHWSRAS